MPQAFQFPNHGRTLRHQVTQQYVDAVTPMHDGFFAETIPPEAPFAGYGLEFIGALTYSGDIRFNLSDGEGGLALVQNDLVRDSGLETAVLISMFSDRRADLEDALPDNTKDLRGWWADATQSDKIGSRLWLLSRSKIENDTNIDAEIYIKECLQWMIDDGVADSIEVTVTRTGTYELSFVLIIERPKGTQDITFKYFFNWESQSLKTGL